MKNKTKKLAVASGLTIAAIYAYNKFVETTATRKNLLKTENGTYFEWKHGNIFYTKQGNGSPVLLIHDTDSRSSGAEWSKINKKLAKNHTVYTIDLIGCGRSDKPKIKYTNYLYVQLITDFVKNVIKDKTDVIATNLSTSFVIMANNLDTNLFNKIILINPISLKDMEAIPDKKTQLIQTLINMPVIGTFLYNLHMNPAKIDIVFRLKYFSRMQLISTKLEDTYYESAHLGKSNGKYLYSSIIANYLNMNMVHAVKNIDKPMYIIGSTDKPKNIDVMDKYHILNNNIVITHVSNSKLYPQLEIPEKTLSIIKANLDK